MWSRWRKGFFGGGLSGLVIVALVNLWALSDGRPNAAPLSDAWWRSWFPIYLPYAILALAAAAWRREDPN